VTSPEVSSVPVEAVPAEFDETERVAADAPQAILLDVREHDEWDLGHAPGATHIPMVDVPARVDELDYDAQLYVVCRQGGRSVEVVKYLTYIGYEAVNVSGGMVAWQRAGRPLVADGDHQAKIY
jgi:rhodanese-related sulfurtransferase